jgi:hypothetical protein
VLRNTLARSGRKGIAKLQPTGVGGAHPGLCVPLRLKNNGTMSRAGGRQGGGTFDGLPVSVDGEMIPEAAAHGDRFQIAHFDSQISVAAKWLGYDLAFAENLSRGQVYERVKVLNPSLLPL